MNDPHSSLDETQLPRIRATSRDRLDELGRILATAPTGSVAHINADTTIKIMLEVLHVFDRDERGDR